MSSSSSSSSSEDGGGNGGGGDYGGPSTTRQRISNGVWPEPFVEALATQVGIDASQSDGRLDAAPALFNLFQVHFSEFIYFCIITCDVILVEMKNLLEYKD